MIDKKKLQEVHKNAAKNKAPKGKPKMPSDPNLTLDVKNDEIEELIVAYSKENSADNLNALLTKIHVSRILVPANLNAQAQPVPFVIKNKSGEAFMPVYTCKEQIPPEPKVPAILNIPYLSVNEMALREEVGADGIVINPFTHNLVFKKPLLERIADVEKKRKEAPQKKTIKLTEQQYTLFERKQFEYIFLPGKFFEDSDKFIEQISDGKEEFIDALYEESYKQKRLYPYLPEDFSVMTMNLSDTRTIVRVDFQTRDVEIGSCVRAYLTWDSDSKRARYFTIEIKSQQERMLCEVDPEHKHISHGDAPVEGAELQTIIDMLDDTDKATS